MTDTELFGFQKNLKYTFTCFRPVVANLLDLTDQQWSAEHQLATAALDNSHIPKELVKN